MPIPERTAANNRTIFFNVLSAQPAAYRIAEFLGTRNHAGELRIRMRREALPAEQVDMARQLPSGQNEPIEMFALLCLCSTIPEMTLLRIALYAKIGRNPSANMLMHNIRQAQLSVILDDCKILHERLIDYYDFPGYYRNRFPALTQELESQIQQIAPERFGELSEHLNQLKQKKCWDYAQVILESIAGSLCTAAITGGFIWAIVEIAKRLEFNALYLLIVYLPISLCACFFCVRQEVILSLD